MTLGEQTLLTESVCRLADRADHVIDTILARVIVLIVSRKVLDLVIGTVKGRTDEIVHAGVHHQETTVLPLLHKQDLRD